MVDKPLQERPSVERAIREYATFHQLDVTTVTEDVVAKSEEGLEWWACRGIDMSARGPHAQCLNRAFQRFPKYKNMYKWLTEDLKKKFRMSWSMCREFDSVVNKRIKIVTNKTKQKEIEVFKSELQLQNHFGGKDSPEACRQAACYIEMCRKYEDFPKVFQAKQGWCTLEAKNTPLIFLLFCMQSQMLDELISFQQVRVERIDGLSLIAVSHARRTHSWSGTHGRRPPTSCWWSA